MRGAVREGCWEEPGGRGIHSCRGIDNERLVCVRVGELGGAFVGGEVGEAAGWDLLPGFRGDGEESAVEEGGGRVGRAGEVRDAEVCRPAVLNGE